MDTNYSISVKPKDVEALQIIKDIKIHCQSKGISFSFIIVKLLKKYHKDILQGKL